MKYVIRSVSGRYLLASVGIDGGWNDWSAAVGDDDCLAFETREDAQEFVRKEFERGAWCVTVEAIETCAHANTTEAVDENGRLVEPAKDVCIDCGEELL